MNVIVSNAQPIFAQTIGPGGPPTASLHHEPELFGFAEINLYCSDHALDEGADLFVPGQDPSSLAVRSRSGLGVVLYDIATKTFANFIKEGTVISPEVDGELGARSWIGLLTEVEVDTTVSEKDTYELSEPVM